MECKCGSQNIEGSKECWNCGELLQAEKKASASSWVVWGLTLGLAAMLGFMVIGSGSGATAGSGAPAGKTATQSVDPTSSAATTKTAVATTGTAQPKRK